MNILFKQNFLHWLHILQYLSKYKHLNVQENYNKTNKLKLHIQINVVKFWISRECFQLFIYELSRFHATNFIFWNWFPW